VSDDNDVQDTTVVKLCLLVERYGKLIIDLHKENAQLNHVIENLRTTQWGMEAELEKADAALDWLNTHCMSAEPIMGRSTYRWTIEHDEPDIRFAIAELRKANRA